MNDQNRRELANRGTHRTPSNSACCDLDFCDLPTRGGGISTDLDFGMVAKLRTAAESTGILEGVEV